MKEHIAAIVIYLIGVVKGMFAMSDLIQGNNSKPEKQMLHQACSCKCANLADEKVGQ